MFSKILYCSCGGSGGPYIDGVVSMSISRLCQCSDWNGMPILKLLRTLIVVHQGSNNLRGGSDGLGQGLIERLSSEPEGWFFLVAFCGFFYCYLFAFCCYNCIFLCSVVLSNTRGISAIVAKIGSSSFSLDFNLRNKLISFNLSYVLYLSRL